MRITLHLCMPAGDASRDIYQRAMEIAQIDNRRVIRAMLNAGEDVPDTVGELELRYVPEVPHFDATGRPLMDVYCLADMVERGHFSCGDAASFESAILEEKYGVPALPVPAPQSDNDFHAVIVTERGIIDPTANFLASRRYRIPNPRRRRVQPQRCEIGEDGRVVCDVPQTCYVDTRGRWHCPDVPGVSGRREVLESIHRSPKGQAWARTKDGAIVPIGGSR
jgi:hypothetical protein